MSTQYLETYNANVANALVPRRMDARDERALLLAAKTGDSAAFEILCKQSANTVFHLARRIMRNNEDAEDVVQESFQRAFIHLQRFNGDSRFSTWLSRIAINAALMKLRKNHRFWEVSLDESPETEQPSAHLDVEDQALNPEQLFAQKERQQILSQVMNELTPGTREAIELRELGERSTEETAQMMGISVTAVKARVFHGRRKLRERLNRFVAPAWTAGRDASPASGITGHLSQDQLSHNACA
jgi:RNA polymerase sigma-70 factor (ECF subfamily)